MVISETACRHEGSAKKTHQLMTQGYGRGKGIHRKRVGSQDGEGGLRTGDARTRGEDVSAGLHSITASSVFQLKLCPRDEAPYTEKGSGCAV